MKRKANKLTTNNQARQTSSIETLPTFDDMKSLGNEYVDRELKLLARNAVYNGVKKGYTNYQLRYFYDLFRRQISPSLMAFNNLCKGLNIDARLIFNEDSLSNDVLSKNVHPNFNPETYRLPSDTW